MLAVGRGTPTAHIRRCRASLLVPPGSALPGRYHGADKITETPAQLGLPWPAGDPQPPDSEGERAAWGGRWGGPPDKSFGCLEGALMLPCAHVLGGQPPAGPAPLAAASSGSQQTRAATGTGTLARLSLCFPAYLPGPACPNAFARAKYPFADRHRPKRRPGRSTFARDVRGQQKGGRTPPGHPGSWVPEPSPSPRRGRSRKHGAKVAGGGDTLSWGQRAGG